MIAAEIVVVEDERILALHLRQQLVKLGYRVPGLASSGAHALRHIGVRRPDLVLMDIHIEGELDGIETAALMVRDHNIPIIYLTAYSEEATLERARGTKPYGYLIKPFSERELHATIQMALERINTEKTLRETEAALRQAQKMEAVGALAGGVAHDFNNLLGIIVGNLELIGETVSHNPELTELVQDALKASLRGASLTHQLLAYARKQPLSPQIVSAKKLIADLADLLKRTLGEKIVVETDLPEGLWKVRVDANLLDTALLNLALNARHAMPDGGSLTFAARNVRLADDRSRPADLSDYVLLSVTDTGVGMTPAILDRALDPFFTTRPVGVGTGLGLSMVDGFVKQSNGHVEIESEPGRGTTVKLHFPAVRTDGAEAGQVLDGDTMPMAVADEVVLVIDGDRLVRKFLAGLLTSLGYRAIEASDGREAERLLEEGDRVDLVLTSEAMRCWDGSDLPGRAGWKVLYTSAYAFARATGDGRTAAAEDLLAKPFRRRALAIAVRRALDSDD
jgi:signal transduction histidine kinase